MRDLETPRGVINDEPTGYYKSETSVDRECVSNLVEGGNMTQTPTSPSESGWYRDSYEIPKDKEDYWSTRSQKTTQKTEESRAENRKETGLSETKPGTGRRQRKEVCRPRPQS